MLTMGHDARALLLRWALRIWLVSGFDYWRMSSPARVVFLRTYKLRFQLVHRGTP